MWSRVSGTATMWTANADVMEKNVIEKWPSGVDSGVVLRAHTVV